MDSSKMTVSELKAFVRKYKAIHCKPFSKLNRQGLLDLVKELEGHATAHKATQTAKAPEPVKPAKPEKKKTKCFYCEKEFVNPTGHIVIAHRKELTYDRTHNKPLPEGFTHYTPKD